MPILLPNAAPPGSLADNTVGAETFRKMRRADRAEIATFTPLPPAGDSLQWKEHITRVPPEKTAEVANRIVDLLRADVLYTGEPVDLVNQGDVEIRLCDPFPNTRLAVFAKEHRIRFSYEGRTGSGDTNLLLDPIGKPLLDLIRRCAPGDTRVQKLSFSPQPPKSPKIPPAIPPAILRVLLSVHPGMRRADVLRVLRTEGGISTRFWRQFIYPKPVNPKGLLAKVTLEFAAATVPIRWVGGVGYPLNRLPDSAPHIGEEHGDDIVISVSDPFLQYGIND